MEGQGEGAKTGAPVTELVAVLKMFLFFSFLLGKKKNSGKERITQQVNKCTVNEGRCKSFFFKGCAR